ncbi:glycosyltransferase 87 family protein [Glaciihabitans sp. dw_435]|uniref:glycosyltransferase 87 family protein n=1 Tax=Glaciihabitans sp. dw_435 TaxID=2720081 RepID=UPI001BD53FE2|nr:glycosyltransferase 87 family protein [Glaciihabitans sp. dw_435]
MTETAPQQARLRTFFSTISHSHLILWAVFVLVHLWLGYINLYNSSQPMGDVSNVYLGWMQQGVYANYWVGIDAPWVYPIVAIVPMFASAAFGFALYSSTWLSMVMVLDAVALAFLTGWGRGRTTVALGWWWTAFLLFLGPVAVGRIDSITIPLAIVGVMLLASRPRVAALLFTLGAWIKIWPVAILAAIVISSKVRGRVIVMAVSTSLAIIGLALAFGSGLHVFSFITEQTGRGLQVEAPVSTIWMWEALAKVPGASVYWSQEILTFQVSGPGADLAAKLMNPLLVIAVIGVAALGLLGVRRQAPVSEMLPPLALAFVSALIAFNKVGSPQYLTWLVVPVLLGLATNAAGHGRPFRAPAIMVLVLALLTQAFYPYAYSHVLNTEPLALIVLSSRNILLFVVFGWAVHSLWRLTRVGVRHERLDEPTSWLPSVWPLAPVGASTTAHTVAHTDTHDLHTPPKE